MPTSKPLSARAFADSCPIPESEAVTIATGLMLLPPCGCLLPKGIRLYEEELSPDHQGTNRIRWIGGSLSRLPARRAGRGGAVPVGERLVRELGEVFLVRAGGDLAPR